MLILIFSKFIIALAQEYPTPNPDIIILLAWNFKDEIINELRQIYKWSGKVIVPLPYEPKIIEI